MVDKSVRIPRSSPRSTRLVYAKLLRQVDPHASNGFGFEGVFLKPGKWVDAGALWPTPEFPRIPILLECAGNTGLTASGRPAQGHDRSELLYILWRYDAISGKWIELARAQSDTWAWALDLRPRAVRAIVSQGTAVVLPSLEVIAVRIDVFLVEQLDGLEPGDRRKILAVLHDQFAWRLAELA